MASKRSNAKNKKKSPQIDLAIMRQGEVWGLVLILLGVVTLLAMLSPRQGALTSWWIEQLRVFVGDGVLLLVLLMIGIGLWGVLRGIGRLAYVPWYRPLGAILLFLAIVIGLHMDGSITDAQALAMAQAGEGGGLLGYGLSELLISTLGYPLAWATVIALAVAGLVLLIGPLLLATGALAMLWLRQRRDDRDIAAGWAGNGDGVPSVEPSWWERFMARLRSFSAGRPELEPDEPSLVIGARRRRAAGCHP